MDNKQLKGFIFRCSNSTQDECFERMLFGEVSAYKQVIEQIKVSDIIYLYNVVSERLYGEFIAKSNGGLNIEPNAWSAKFPYQVKIDYLKKFEPIRKRDFDTFVKFGGNRNRYPNPVLTEEQITRLRVIFEEAGSLPSSEREFRDSFPATKRADDGHWVRSFGELTIDNWLFHQGICHGYERKLPITEGAYCDFFIPNKNGYIYLEYWGLEDNKYLERKRNKKAIYEKHKYALVEIEPRDLENLDDVMPRKIRLHLPNHEFI